MASFPEQRGGLVNLGMIYVWIWVDLAGSKPEADETKKLMVLDASSCWFGVICDETRRDGMGWDRMG